MPTDITSLYMRGIQINIIIIVWIMYAKYILATWELKGLMEKSYFTALCFMKFYLLLVLQLLRFTPLTRLRRRRRKRGT